MFRSYKDAVSGHAFPEFHLNLAKSAWLAVQVSTMHVSCYLCWHFGFIASWMESMTAKIVLFRGCRSYHSKLTPDEILVVLTHTSLLSAQLNVKQTFIFLIWRRKCTLQDPPAAVPHPGLSICTAERERGKKEVDYIVVLGYLSFFWLIFNWIEDSESHHLRQHQA